MRSVKMKIIWLVISCIVVSSALVGGASILNSRRVVSDDSAQIMNLLCANRSEEINALLDRIEQSVKTLTAYAARGLDDVARWKTDAAYVEAYTDRLQNTAVNAAQNTEGALTVYIRYNPDFTHPQSGLFCSRSSEENSFKELTPTNLAQYDPSDREHVGWFYEPARNKKGTWMVPYLNQNIGVEMISYVIPYYVQGVFIGVVGMDIDYSVLEEVVAKTRVYQSGYAFLTDDLAAIAYHKDLEMGTDLTAYNQGEFSGMAETLKTGKSNGALFGYTYKGEKRVMAFNVLQNGMRLVLTVPVAEVDRQANTLIVQIAGAVIVIVALATLLTIVFTRRLVRPLLELNEAAKKIADGDLGVSITHQSKDEVGTLAESFRQTVAHLHKYISYINELAYRDSLTGCKNKTAYLEAVRQLDEQTRLKRPAYAVVVFDINGLKQVNDTLGHDFGDMLISGACKIISGVFQHSPVYRIGGDEFVALLENGDYDRYMELLDTLEEALNRHNREHRQTPPISVARGIAVFSEETDLTFHDVFKRADSAMYRNKEEMKNKVLL